MSVDLVVVYREKERVNCNSTLPLPHYSLKHYTFMVFLRGDPFFKQAVLMPPEFSGSLQQISSGPNVAVLLMRLTYHHMVVGFKPMLAEWS